MEYLFKTWNFIKKKTLASLAHVFSCKFCEISKKTFFIEQLRKTDSKTKFISFFPFFLEFWKLSVRRKVLIYEALLLKVSRGFLMFFNIYLIYESFEWVDRYMNFTLWTKVYSILAFVIGEKGKVFWYLSEL